MPKPVARRFAGHNKNSAPAVLLSLLVAVSSGCITGTIEPNPALELPFEVWQSRIRTLCLREATIGVAVEEEPMKQTHLESILAQDLETLGFTVVRSPEVEGLEKEIANRLGGYYDAHWGKIIDSQYDAVAAEFYEQSASRLGCDAHVETRVVQVESALYENAAKWDHVRSANRYYYVGYLPALSVRITISDAPDHDIYYGAGGLQLAATLERDEFTEAHFERVETSDLLSNAESNRRGIRSALMALAGAHPDGAPSDWNPVDGTSPRSSKNSR